MRKLFVIALLFAAVLAAQDNIAGVGLSYSPGATPAVAGTGIYAKKVAGTGTFAFTAVDVLPSSYKPFTVTTQVSTGVAQRIFTLGVVGVYIPTSAGISYNGTNTGWAWTTGGLLDIPINKTQWRIQPNLRVVKSSVNNNSGYQLIGGLLFGWGW